ncbi:MAG TPA: DUF3617 domain-containing protein [Hyphomicrobiales bacterium]|nr:DUF3617 domain-containing protein [Hyphomicrobiales bacterium]
MSSIKAGMAVVAAAAMVAVPGAALAAGMGKPGLWQVTTTMGSDMAKMIPPEALAQMKARGISLPSSRTITTKQCVTPEQAAKGPPTVQGDCRAENVRMGGGDYSADLVCHGRASGSGHIHVVYDSSEHYRGDMTMHISGQGHAMNMTNHFEAHWLKADCAGADSAGGMMGARGGVAGGPGGGSMMMRMRH